MCEIERNFLDSFEVQQSGIRAARKGYVDAIGLKLALQTVFN